VRRIIFLLLIIVVAPGAGAGAPDFFEGFKGDWRSKWREEKLSTRPTLYSVVADETGRSVLHAHSVSAHAGLLRPLELPSPTSATLRWRWKVPQALTGNDRERTRAGDDYAARVFVVFETSAWPLRTRAINYVWAAHEAVGAVFPSPYTRNVGMVVLRSGDTEAGVWQDERRDVLADYRNFFGAPPTCITAIAILVDTDNTGKTAEAWFADLTLASSPVTTDVAAP
jgi:hypothetical protein